MKNKKGIIIASAIFVGVGSIAFYFIYWRRKDGVSQSDKAMLQSATALQMGSATTADTTVSDKNIITTPTTVMGPVPLNTK